MPFTKTLQEFREKFPYIPHADNFGADGSVTGGSDIKKEVESFLTEAIQDSHKEGYKQAMREVVEKCKTEEKPIIQATPQGTPFADVIDNFERQCKAIGVNTALATLKDWAENQIKK